MTETKSPTKTGLSFEEWKTIVLRKVKELGMVVTVNDESLKRLWTSGKSTGFIVSFHAMAASQSVEAHEGAKVLKWASTQTPAQSAAKTPLRGFGSHAPLEEQVLDPMCPLDTKIAFAWESVRIARGQLGFAEYYASEANAVAETERLTEVIAQAQRQIESINTVHLNSQAEMERLADVCAAAEQVHKNLLIERERKREALEAERLRRAGKSLNIPTPRGPKKLTRDEVLVKYGITTEVLEQFRASGQDPEALIKRMMGV